MGSSRDPQWDWDMGLPSEVWKPLGEGSKGRLDECLKGLGCGEPESEVTESFPAAPSHAHRKGRPFFLTA